MATLIPLTFLIKFPTNLFEYIDDDDNGLPHEKSKREYAPFSCIIDSLVDPKLMRVSMDEEDSDLDHTRLIQHAADFAATAPGPVVP
jgi:hypothetical protein